VNGPMHETRAMNAAAGVTGAGAGAEAIEGGRTPATAAATGTTGQAQAAADGFTPTSNAGPARDPAGDMPAPVLQGIHHVAYRCRDAGRTVEFYREVLGMDFMLAIAEDRVPSTGEPDPYTHLFLDAGGGNVLAFFELPNAPEMGRDEATPAWVQHIALKVADLDSLLAAKARAEAHGLEVVGPTHHGIFKSIYFFDPDGHRLELACDIGTADEMQLLKEVAEDMLAEWTRTKKAPRHAAWLHEKSARED